MAPESQTVYADELGHAVHSAHLAWQFDPLSTSDVSGQVATRTIGPVRVSWLDLMTGPSGWRGRRTFSCPFGVGDAFFTAL